MDRFSRIVEQVLVKFFIYFEKIQAYVILFIVTPGFFLIEIVYVRNNLIEIYKPSYPVIVINTGLTIFGFVNIFGNYAMNLVVNNNVKIIDDRYADETWTYCDICKKKRPPKSWHCKSCHACILGRDHHCFFMARCIGQYNKRFYLLYSAHLFIGMIYCAFFNSLFIYASYQDLLSLINIYHTLVSTIDRKLAITSDYDALFKELFLFFYKFNLFLIIWSAGLLNYHLRNAMHGISSHERKAYQGKLDLVVKDKRDNLVRVFGKNWLWTAVWPLAVSPLPDEKVD